MIWSVAVARGPSVALSPGFDNMIKVVSKPSTYESSLTSTTKDF
jgi:hypothetical protein